MAIGKTVNIKEVDCEYHNISLVYIRNHGFPHIRVEVSSFKNEEARKKDVDHNVIGVTAYEVPLDKDLMDKIFPIIYEWVLNKEEFKNGVKIDPDKWKE